MEQLAKALSTIPDQITEPSEFLLNGGTEPAKEPTDEELAAELDTELEDLLSESLTLKNKKTSRGALAGVKKALFEREKQSPWRIKQYIAVWTRTTCKCGNRGEFLFVRNMRQMEKSGIIHWETTASIPQGEKFLDTLIEREVTMCGKCQDLCENNMKSFSEITDAKAKNGDIKGL